MSDTPALQAYPIIIQAFVILSVAKDLLPGDTVLSAGFFAALRMTIT